MVGQLRIEYQGAFYHVTTRGNEGRNIFFGDNDRETFLRILERTKWRYGYLLHAYAVMDRQVYLLVETPKANLFKIMQNFNTNYTVFINRKYNRSGHQFRGRYKAIL